MMTDDQLEQIYKANIAESHSAGLRGVYDAGYDAATGIFNDMQAPDASATANAPTVDETITTV